MLQQAAGIRVSIFFPSTIDTPGLAEENKTKPKETDEIEGAWGHNASIGMRWLYYLNEIHASVYACALWLSCLLFC